MDRYLFSQACNEEVVGKKQAKHKAVVGEVDISLPILLCSKRIEFYSETMLHWLGITGVMWEIKNVGWINNNNKLMGVVV